LVAIKAREIARTSVLLLKSAEEKGGREVKGKNTPAIFPFQWGKKKEKDGMYKCDGGGRFESEKGRAALRFLSVGEREKKECENILSLVGGIHLIPR